jgi:hypothetical protein
MKWAAIELRLRTRLFRRHKALRAQPHPADCWESMEGLEVGLEMEMGDWLYYLSTFLRVFLRFA